MREEKTKTLEVFRSLENYKAMHKSRAQERGCLAQFMACKTLTEARKWAFGTKTGCPPPKAAMGKRT